MKPGDVTRDKKRGRVWEPPRLWIETDIRPIYDALSTRTTITMLKIVEAALASHKLTADIFDHTVSAGDQFGRRARAMQKLVYHAEAFVLEEAREILDRLEMTDQEAVKALIMRAYITGYTAAPKATGHPLEHTTADEPLRSTAKGSPR